ncbi:MAG: DUF4870 domain-containing protein [Planctomycetota bacterium]|jgi:uncharacterized Tic20 family protein
MSNPDLSPAGNSAPSSDDRNMALLAHVLAIFTGFIGPLIIWLIKKDGSPFVDDHGKEALNFQITVLIASIVSAVLAIVVIGVFLLLAIAICNLVFCILAAVAASNGEFYRYPMTIRLLS